MISQNLKLIAGNPTLPRTVIKWLIQISLRNRALVLGAATVLLVLGTRAMFQLPVEVLPDLTKPTVTILTEAPGLAPEEVESLVTVPMESALMGVPGLSRLRSTSDVALSLIFVEFDWGTDIYRARQFVQERLQSATESLPEGVHPYLTPVASLMGEIMLVGMRSKDKRIEPRDLRTMADWTVRRRLQSIPGIAEVLSMGGGVKQIQIQPNPDRMRATGISFEELRNSAKEAVSNTTGGFLTSGPQEIMVRNLAMSTDLSAIASTVIKSINDRPIKISDVADVIWEVEPMRGDAAVNGSPGVILSVTKAPGFDTIELTDKVENEIEKLRKIMPEGVELIALFRQSDFINHAIGNLKEAIRDGSVMVICVLFIFLLSFRTTLITLTAIPLSFSITLLVFQGFGISVNSMTLGGLAVTIGMVVDDALVDMENVFRRLKENASLSRPEPRIQVIAKASNEVRNSILYATILIMLVFLPLLGLTGVEGRLFAPIAIATIVSIGASFFVSITVIPVLCYLLLRPKEGVTHGDGIVVRALKWLLKKTLLRLALNQPIVLLAFVSIMIAGSFSLYPFMGKDFLPAFNEETALVSLTTAPGTSLKQTNEVAAIADDLLLSIPEVNKVGRRVGRAERGDHVVPVSTVEFDIDFEASERSRAEVLEDIRNKVRQIPGTFSVLTGPLADRIGHMLSGVSAKVAIKVFGDDLDEIQRIGNEILKIAREVPGFESARVEQQAPIPQLRIEINRERAQAYGVTPGSLNEQLSSLIGGENVAQLYEGQRTMDLVIRLPEEWRESPEKLSNMFINSKDGKLIPLRLVADIRSAKGPNVIQREGKQRRLVVSINPTKRDLKGSVEMLQNDVIERVKIPDGYDVRFEGEYKAQQEATKRIAFLSAGVFIIMVFLLCGFFKTVFFPMQVIFDILLAFIGGIAFTWIRVDNISIATMVGFIAVAGIASRNSILLISHYLHLMRFEGERFTREMVERGTLERQVPVLMTALATGIALIPLILAADAPGKEILHPVAVVIVGGLITSTLLGLGVTPAIFYAFGRRASERSVALKSAASD